MSELPFTPPPEDKPAAPAPAPAPKAVPVQRPRPVVRRPIIVQESSKRDTVIALLCGAGVLLFIIVGMWVLKGEQGKPSRNQLTGVIVAKNASGEVEKDISIGKKGLKSQVTDSGFSFTVQVPPDNREYEVPVNEGQYNAQKIGDKIPFIRPPSEQR